MQVVAEKTKWQLTREAFDALLRNLDADRTAAGEKYLRLRKNLVRFFETRGIVQTEEAADETLNRLARKLEGGEQFENVNTYALGVARMLALELRKSPAQKTSNEIPEIAAAPFDAESEENDLKLHCLDDCLKDLSPENREIIVGYYQGEKREKIENRNHLAESLNIPQNALRNRAVRLRDKLESCIKDCLRKA
jgi:RNA polymerase sigma factor (sigma-70 family)